MKYKITGYYPSGYTTEVESKLEGGPLDCFGKKLRTLQDKDGYVSIAVDPKVIPLKSYVSIEGFPDVIFYACDVGSAIRGEHIDICVATKKDAYTITGYKEVTVHGKTYIRKG